MSLKERNISVNPGTVLSVFSLLLYSAGFIRNELKFNDYDQRLEAIEEDIPQLKVRSGEMAKASNEAPTKQNTVSLQRVRRIISSPTTSNDSAYIKEVLEDIFTSSLKICQKRRNFNICQRGRPGPPGEAGTKGDKGDEGRRGRKGFQGVMGPPGKSGKQGTVGPPGIRGEKGIKGDIGPPGIPGIKGEPGESIAAPNVRVSPLQLTVNKSNTAALLCSVSGNPAAQISWTRVNGSLPSNRTKVKLDGVMQINDVRLEDSGKYKCLAQNILGKDEKTASLIVQSQPKVSLSFGPSYVEKNKNITLPECHVTSFPHAVIKWSKVHGELVYARSALKEGRLSILKAQKRDSGLYKCKSSNKLGQDSAVTHLSVVELPHFTVSPPSKLNVGTERNITVPCQASGDPQPSVTWSRENGDLPPGRSKVSVDGTLQIWIPKAEDSGRYTCTASSNEIFAKATSTMELTVKVCGPVGVADTNIIPDARMTASTAWSMPYHGRLNEKRGYKAWCPKTESDRTDYLQVDMGAVRSICAVATQGRETHSEWVTSYKLQLSTDGVTWNAYKENNFEKVFQGNTDRNGIVQNSLTTEVKARYVRFYSVTYFTYPCWGVEIFVLE